MARSTAFQTLGPLQQGTPIIEKNGGPTSQFQRLFNDSYANSQFIHDKAQAAGDTAAAAQPGDPTLDALAGLSASAGLVEQTGADTFTKRALGVGASTSVPTRADADGRYVKQSGALKLAIRSVSATAALAATDFTVLCDATSGAVTANLPAAVDGTVYVIKKTDVSANAVTVDGNASETIDGATTLVLAAQWDSCMIQALGGAWFRI